MGCGGRGSGGKKGDTGIMGYFKGRGLGGAFQSPAHPPENKQNKREEEETRIRAMRGSASSVKGRLLCCQHSQATVSSCPV